MTLKELIEDILLLAQDTDNINYANEGNIFELNSLPNIDYSVFYITQNQHTQYENTTRYSFTFFYVDRLINEEESLNKLQIQSDGIQILSNIINKINETLDVEISYPINFQPFTEKFSDSCAGVYCTLIITVPNLGICSY